MPRLIFFVSLCSLILPTQSLQSAEQRARLEVRVDENRFFTIDVFFRGDDILVRLTDLANVGIRPTGGRIETIHSEPYVSLKSLSRQLSFQLNQTDLALYLRTKPDAATRPPPSQNENLLAPVAPVATSIERRSSNQTDLPARLGVQWNGVRKGEVSVILRNNDILAPLENILAIDPSLTHGRRETIRGETYVSIESLSSELSFTVDERSLGLLLAT